MNDPEAIAQTILSVGPYASKLNHPSLEPALANLKQRIVTALKAADEAAEKRGIAKGLREAASQPDCEYGFTLYLKKRAEEVEKE